MIRDGKNIEARRLLDYYYNKKPLLCIYTSKKYKFIKRQGALVIICNRIVDKLKIKCFKDRKIVWFFKNKRFKVSKKFLDLEMNYHEVSNDAFHLQ